MPVEQKLAAPGAGIGFVEMFVLNWILGPLLFRNSGREGALRRLRASADEIDSLLAEIDEARLTDRVLVDRPFFVEDSSRYWSAAMLCRHLTKVNGMLAQAIENGVEVSEAQPPPARNRLAAVKPEPEKNDFRACDDFRATVNALAAAALKHSERDLARRRIPHPWLGPISHLQWIQFAAFHHRVHARQLRRIARRLRTET